MGFGTLDNSLWVQIERPCCGALVSHTISLQNGSSISRTRLRDNHTTKAACCRMSINRTCVHSSGGTGQIRIGRFGLLKPPLSRLFEAAVDEERPRRMKRSLQGAQNENDKRFFCVA